MERSEFLKRAGAMTASLMFASVAPGWRSAVGQASKPNVLLIMTDDQPHHTTGIMGSLRSKVAAAGVRFDNGYVATPVCGPARGSVLTGKWSHNTGLETTEGAWRDLTESGELARNVAARMEAAGYACHMSGKFTNGLSTGEWVCPGFSSWRAQLDNLDDREYLYFSDGGNGRLEMPRTDTEAGNETLVAAKYTEDFVREHRDEPWFACFWPHAPHGPYYPLGKYAGTHGGERPPTGFGEPRRDLSDKASLVRKLADFSAETEMMRTYRRKLREVEEVDDAVERLVTVLEETNQIDRTWIFFVTDNGFQHGEHFLSKKLWPYEESTRTPFVVRGPGIPSTSVGTTNKHLVSQVDLLPTICEIGGADASGVDGRSILPILADPDAPFRELLLVEAEGRGWHSVRMRKRDQTRSEYSNLLFVKWRDGFEEIYDYDKDPHQYQGGVSSAREKLHVDMLRDRLPKMRTASGDRYRALEQAR